MTSQLLGIPNFLDESAAPGAQFEQQQKETRTSPLVAVIQFVVGRLAALVVLVGSTIDNVLPEFLRATGSAILVPTRFAKLPPTGTAAHRHCRPQGRHLLRASLAAAEVLMCLSTADNLLRDVCLWSSCCKLLDQLYI